MFLLGVVPLCCRPDDQQLEVESWLISFLRRETSLVCEDLIGRNERAVPLSQPPLSLVMNRSKE